MYITTVIKTRVMVSLNISLDNGEKKYVFFLKINILKRNWILVNLFNKKIRHI